MLTWTDIDAMLDGCYNARDQAVIALQFDAGLRGGELSDLKIDVITYWAKHAAYGHIAERLGYPDG